MEFTHTQEAFSKWPQVTAYAAVKTNVEITT